ncbi:MAG: RAD55 family ATPase [Nanoarchaeota archaeon]|nr:RAD55 family ATPase [Nanoarchaeota archaeon]MBU4300219.1 RAD55 family ATPase [Nanoarchaeota archaeon]MBU4451605.1 RAD55 family ATPase [Nanoarchaeota archaeon]MCG2723127.1 RAD55 family ATPase [archaeon]
MAIKPNNTSTGIPKLDGMLEGGFPESTSVLLYGTPGVGKSIFCQQFMHEGLKKNERCIFLTFDVRPETIETSMSRFGWETKNKIIFLDCFSYRIGVQSSSRYALTGLSDLNQLSMIFEDMLNDVGKERKRIVVDSLSTLLLYSDPELSLKFLKDFIASAISQKSTLLFTIEEGIHDEKTVAILNYMAEGLIEMKFEMDKRLLRVAKMRGTAVSRSWAEFDVTKKGIVIM